jgi:hypothetical protein
VVNEYMTHTVVLNYMEQLDLRKWLTAPKGEYTFGRITLRATAQNCIFISTVPDTARAKPRKPEEQDEQ